MAASEVTAGSIWECKAREAERMREWSRAVCLNLEAAKAFESQREWAKAEACWREVCVSAERQADAVSKRRGD